MYKIFDNFAKQTSGIHFFAPDNAADFEKNKPTAGFGSLKYNDGSVYVGGVYFDGKNYHKQGFGKQDWQITSFGGSADTTVKRVTFIGGFDYVKTGWIYGNGVMYYVDGQGKPARFIKGFFHNVEPIGEYRGVFDYSSLMPGYTADMEYFTTERNAMFSAEIGKYVEGFENLFIGDSYFELWMNGEYANPTFYESYDVNKNLNIGIGGSTFLDWAVYADRLKGLSEPKRIFINLGINDFHCGKSAESVFDDIKVLLSKLRSIMPKSKIYVLSVVHAPNFLYCRENEIRWNKLLAENAETLGVRVIDISPDVNDGFFYKDKLHPNAEGYRVIKKHIDLHISESEK